MKISLSNIGSIKGSSIKIGDLTVIAGENDTGKKYLREGALLDNKILQYILQ